jgi:peroxiredoxin
MTRNCLLVFGLMFVSGLVSQPTLGVELDRYWFLIHDRAVIADLELSADEQAAVRKEIDPLDLQFMSLRGTTPEKVAKELPEIIAVVKRRLHEVLKPEQERRLAEIVLRVQGPAGLLRMDIAAQMKFTADQKKKVEKITEETQKEIGDLERQLKEGKPQEPLRKEAQKLRNQEQEDVYKVLSKSQQALWRKLAGETFDVARVGKMAFKAPEIVDTNIWVNSQPLSLSQQKGKVVALHFYTHGCINCIHNYPWLRAWYDELTPKGLVIVGIHTPEGEGEKVIESIKKKANEEKLLFPIVVDNEKQNWNAWGNSMWPTVYLIDKQGYMRTYWMGELKWQGTDGEKIIREQIEELLSEDERR